MGLARLRMMRHLPQDVLLLQEIDLAMQNATRTINTPTERALADFSPCHGLSGQAELLLESGLTFERTDARAAADNVGELGIQIFGKHTYPWTCGMPGAGETASLMTGLAGIGYFYLRLFNPGKHASVLLPPLVAA